MWYSTLWLLAHGADPRPIAPDEATANLVKFFVTMLLALVMSYPVLAPLFPKNADSEPSQAAEAHSGLLGWLALGLLLVLSMAWWLTRTTVVELMTDEGPKEEHAHTQERGGQVAMWGDFHAEVARIESGEVRVYLTDSYNRPIAARFFEAQIEPLPESQSTVPAEQGLASLTQPNLPPTPPSTGSIATVPALNDTYRFARLDRQWRNYRVRVSTPGWNVTLKFAFSEDQGRRSLPIWCGTPE